MAGTDILTGNIDTNINNDHTYYGNGCQADWKNEPPYYGGSNKSCETNITKTLDDEDQKMGSYYNLKASALNIGNSQTADNTNTPDSFCPLGWQLPYSGTGGDYYDQPKSWRYLLTTYNDNVIPSGSEGSSIMGNYPLSYIRSGYYALSRGVLYSFRKVYYQFSGTFKNSTSAYRLYITADDLKYSESGTLEFEFAVRCFLQLHRRHGGRNKC